MKLEFSQKIFEKKKRKYQFSLKIDPVVPELFHEEGQTGWQRQHDEANRRFSLLTERA